MEMYIQMVKCINVFIVEPYVHPVFMFTVEFKSFSWSPDETKIIYIAEKKLPTREPFYKRKSENSVDYSINKDHSITSPIKVSIKI